MRSGVRDRIARNLAAVAVMAAVLLLQGAVWPYIQPSPFLLLTAGVLVAGMYGEWAPGLLATAIGALGVQLFFLPEIDGAAVTGRDAITLLLFLAVGTMVTWINVQRRKSLQAATEKERWLATTLRSIGDAVIATDRAGRVRFLNAGAEELTGWRSHRAAGRPLRDVFHTEVADTHTVLVSRQGIERLVEESRAPILDGAGNLTGTVVVFRDASERVGEDLRRALLAEATEVLVGSLDVEATLAAVAGLLVPRAADRVTVHLVREDGRLELLALAAGDPAADPHLPAGLDRVRAEVVESGTAQLLPTAMVVPLVARGRVLGAMAFSLTGQARRFSARDLEVAEDLARRAASAVDTAHLYQEAQDAIRVRDEFLAIASHELRTPLTTLQLQLDSLERTAEHLAPQEAAGLRRKLASSSRQAVRLANLIDNLLDVARITTGRLAIKPEWMDLVEVARETAERFQDQARAAGCALHLDPAEPHIDVHWDRLRVEQVLA
ncbi:MAG TPA: histidine kinase dimerization/phospho-acceptor domain-containing protein, partial [Kofleriaceae bacterium]|nr:histidine kinase dimerization/phospho-acceptor domain-containing protein [Kofleriaceae bacterium]